MSQTNLSILPTSAPNIADYIVTNPKQRRELGISPAYADTYNSAMANKYQADYNEYIYNKYQSPSAMAQQYEAAGLNRNFAEQSGGNISVPNQNFKSNIQQNQLDIVNTLIGAVSKGVELTSELTSLPKDLAFKQYRNILAGHNINIADSREMSALARAFYDASYYGGVSYDPWIMNGTTWDPSNSPAMNQADLRNTLMKFKIDSAKWDLENLKPEELKRIQALIRQIGANAGISEKTLQWFDTSKFAAIYGPAILSLIRGLM